MVALHTCYDEGLHHWRGRLASSTFMDRALMLLSVAGVGCAAAILITVCSATTLGLAQATDEGIGQ